VTVITVQNGLILTDPTAAALWDVSLPLSRASDDAKATKSRPERRVQPSHDLVVLRHVSKTFPARGKAGAVTALKDVSLAVRAGEIYGIIGRSGAGKSTLIRLINGLELPTSGTVEVARVDLAELAGAELRQQRRSIGMIFQHFNLLSSRNVFGNIALPLELGGTSRTDIDCRVTELLDLVGLADKRNAYPAELSGGQKQRVAIARALATNPRILLSDEATSSLDPETTRSILGLLARINRELGVTIILITHQMPVIKEICHRVGVIGDGRIVEEANVYDFFADPKSVAAKALAGHVAEEALPDDLRAILSTTPQTGGDAVLRLTLAGAAATGPTLSRVGRDSGVDLVILQGQVETVAGRALGSFLVRVAAAAVVRADAAADIRGLPFEEALRRYDVKAEVLGYVA
jgi:D-methionine transport system ATP-binding protein